MRSLLIGLEWACDTHAASAPVADDWTRRRQMRRARRICHVALSLPEGIAVTPRQATRVASTRPSGRHGPPSLAQRAAQVSGTTDDTPPTVKSQIFMPVGFTLS